jgi:hypothetical protein
MSYDNTTNASFPFASNPFRNYWCVWLSAKAASPKRHLKFIRTPNKAKAITMIGSKHDLHHTALALAACALLLPAHQSDAQIVNLVNGDFETSAANPQSNS